MDDTYTYQLSLERQQCTGVQRHEASMWGAKGCWVGQRVADLVLPHLEMNSTFRFVEGVETIGNQDLYVYKAKMSPDITYLKMGFCRVSTALVFGVRTALATLAGLRLP